MGLFNKILKEPYQTDEVHDFDIESIYVACTDFYTDNIRYAGSENPYYSMSKKQLVDNGNIECNIFKRSFFN